MNKKLFKADKDKIKSCLNPGLKDMKIITMEETGSTNDELKKIAVTEKEKDVLLIAEKQTKGRGRKGRQFFSPGSTGIYMSLLLHPDFPSQEIPLITPLCAVAVYEAIKKVTGINTDIKWVNDIYLKGKKIAGILTEGAFSQGKAEYIIVGMGINLAMPEEDFPEEIKGIAGALTENSAKIKNEIIGETVNSFMHYYNDFSSKKFVAIYRSRLNFLGKKITVFSPQGNYEATAVDIDDNCHLTVEKSDSSLVVLSSGEISIKI